MATDASAAGARADRHAGRPGLPRVTAHGAWVGMKAATLIFSPIVVLPVAFGIAVMAFGAGSGRGWGLPRVVLLAWGGLLVAVAWGAVLGGLIGLGFGVADRFRPGIASRALSPFRRPIPLFGRRGRREDAAAPDPNTAGRFGWLWVVGALLVGVEVIAWGLGAYAGWWVDRRLDAAIAAADRDDPGWRLEDVLAAREVVPDDENGALVVSDTVSLLPETWPEAPPPDAAPAVLWPREAYDRMTESPPNVRMDDATADVLADDLEIYDDAIQFSRRVADYRRGRHELEIAPNILGTPLDETQAARNPARLLQADAALRAHWGDVDGAIASCRALLGVGRSIGDEPFAISQLVRIAIDGVAMSAIRRSLGQGEASEQALARLQADILRELDYPMFLDAMRGERAAMVEMIRRVGSGEVPISALTDTVSLRLIHQEGRIAPWGRLMFDHQRAVALEWMNGLVALARRPAADWPDVARAWEAEVERRRKTWHAPFTATLPSLLTPAMSASIWAHLRHRSELGSMATLVAAERHRLRHGEWPESAGAIDRDILPSPPIDPFSGETFRMARGDGQLVVYSIGPNRRDEGAAYNPRLWMKGKTDDDVGGSAWDVPLRGLPDAAMAESEG